MTKASRTDSRYWATSAGSEVSGAAPASGSGVTQAVSASAGPRNDSSGGEAGPMSTGRARRWTWRLMSMHTLVAIRYSQDRTLERPSKRSALRHALTSVSWTASSASNPEPSIR